MNYMLMHKDEPAAKVKIDLITGMILSVKVLRRELLPLGTAGDSNQLRKWWAQRATPISQGNLRQVLWDNNIATPQSLLVRCLGLSLSDHYWICPEEKALSWKDVSLFSNSFAYADRSFRKTFPEELSDDTLIALLPSGSMNGEMQKKWIIEGSKRRLLKRGTVTCQQAVNEVIASQIHSRQGKFPYAQYELCHLQSDMGVATGCLCDCFADEQLEFVPAIDVVNSVKKRNEVSVYQHFIDVCNSHGLDGNYVRSFLEYQILTDFVISNTDRHLNNFGVLRDSNSLRFVSIAPIFDSGNSMFWANPKAAKSIDLLNIPVNSFRQTERELLGYITQPEIVDVTKLPKRNELELLMWHEDLIGVDAILDAYEQKVRLLELFQRGRPLVQGVRSFDALLCQAEQTARERNCLIDRSTSVREEREL